MAGLFLIHPEIAVETNLPVGATFLKDLEAFTKCEEASSFSDIFKAQSAACRNASPDSFPETRKTGGRREKDKEMKKEIRSEKVVIFSIDIRKT